jgi:transcriptional regulator GlxA family with amidase domain
MVGDGKKPLTHPTPVYKARDKSDGGPGPSEWRRVGGAQRSPPGVISSGYSIAMKRKIGFIGFNDINALDLTGPAEAFASAADYYEVLVVGETMAPFRAESGVLFQPNFDLASAPAFDTIVVPGGKGLRTGTVGDAFDKWLAKRVPTTRRIASVCTGAYALARIGALDGRRVATHWRFLQDLQSTFPKLAVDGDALFVKDGKFYTAAGVTAGIDLALALIEEDHGSKNALSVAREMVVYLKRPGGQSQYSEPLQYQTRAVDGFDGLPAWILANLHQDLSVEKLAERANLGVRHFGRRFKSVFGATPSDFVLGLRMTEARSRLLLPRSNVDQIATSIGFNSAASFRRAFEKHYGLSPKSYRDRFNAT